MTSSWYCNPDALPALVVFQRASVSTGFSGIRPSGLWKYRTSSRSTPSSSTVVSVSMKRPFSSMACSLNSATDIPLGSNPYPLTLALTRLESTYISGNNIPSRSNSSFRPSNMAAKPSRPIRSMKWLMEEWSNTGSSMVKKQNQR